MSGRSPITTHVLDTSSGRPAGGVAVALEGCDRAGLWRPLATGVTGEDGRLMDLLPAGSPIGGRYRLSFATGEYFQRRSQATIYPTVAIEFVVAEPAEHYHLPLLLSPGGYTTYRGS